MAALLSATLFCYPYPIYLPTTTAPSSIILHNTARRHSALFSFVGAHPAAHLAQARLQPTDLPFSSFPSHTRPRVYCLCCFHLTHCSSAAQRITADSRAFFLFSFFSFSFLSSFVSLFFFVSFHPFFCLPLCFTSNLALLVSKVLGTFNRFRPQSDHASQIQNNLVSTPGLVPLSLYLYRCTSYLCRCHHRPLAHRPHNLNAIATGTKYHSSTTASAHSRTPFLFALSPLTTSDARLLPQSRPSLAATSFIDLASLALPSTYQHFSTAYKVLQNKYTLTAPSSRPVHPIPSLLGPARPFFFPFPVRPGKPRLYQRHNTLNGFQLQLCRLQLTDFIAILTTATARR